VSALAIGAPAQGATIGTLTQLASPNGCIADASAPITGCGTGRGLLGTAPFFGSNAVALSSDGKNVYSASFNSNGIAVFDRNRTTGVLAQKAGAAGCIANEAVSGCALGRAMLKAVSVAVSSDGKSVYVASIAASSVAIFDRDGATGALSQKAGTAGCITELPVPACTDGRGLGGADAVTVSPDGRSVYVASFTGDAVVIFDRSRSTGALVQKVGPAGCIAASQGSDCHPNGRGLKGAEGVTISPDGKSVYVGAPIGNAVAVFKRNRATGKLDQPVGRSGCVALHGNDGCASGDGLIGAEALQVSPDNKNLYVASGIGDSVAAFARNPKTSQITQLAGVAGCYTNFKRSLGRCASGVELDGPEGIAISPDGNTVYVGSFYSNAIGVFDRDSFTGTITQRAGANGCIVNTPTSGCTTGKGLGNANALAISRDGRSVYAGSYESNAVDVFSRAVPLSGHVTTSVPRTLLVPERGAASIPVKCTGTLRRRCPGGLTLQAPALELAGAARQVTIGRGSFNIAIGKTKHVPVVLSVKAYRYLNNNGSLTATAIMRVVQPTGQVKVFRQRIVLSVVDGRG